MSTLHRMLSNYGLLFNKIILLFTIYPFLSVYLGIASETNTQQVQKFEAPQMYFIPYFKLQNFQNSLNR